MFPKLNQQAIYAGLICAVLTVGAFFMANVDLPAWSHYLSAVNVVLFALPSLWAVRWWLGWRDGAILIAVLGAYALLIEASAILTGFPYGHFGYSDLLGYRIFGLVPWTVAFAWTPLLLGTYAVAANLFSSRVLRIVATTLLLMLFDFVLDPGAVMLGFWKYDGGGLFYGVPMSNFGGWLISGLVGTVLLEILIAIFKPLLPTPIQLSSSAFFIVFFWTAIAAFGGLVAPALIGATLIAALIFFYRRSYYSFDDMIVFVDDSNNPLATGRKLASHDADTKLHRAFSVFLFNSKGEFLMQQRALAKKTWPGVWSNTCCGHVMLHESVERAAKRRLKDELGLKGIDLQIALSNFRYRAEKDGVVENEICPVLVGCTDGDPKPNPEEVESFKWIDWKEFLRTLDDPETDISPWAVQEVRELVESEVFRKLFNKRS